MKKNKKRIDKNNKIYGIIPARMAASRFPGKPLKKSPRKFLSLIHAETHEHPWGNYSFVNQDGFQLRPIYKKHKRHKLQN